MSDGHSGEGIVPANRSAIEYFHQFIHILGRSEARWRITAFAIAIIVIIIFTAIGQIRLNHWQGAFYDAVSKHDFPAFLTQLAIFGEVVLALLALGVGQTWLHQTLRIRLRQIITQGLLDEWLQPMRAYRLSLSGEIGANPDQRIHEDARRLAELTTDLCVGLIQSGLILISFIGVLWSLSPKVTFVYADAPFTIPGYMVWCAVGYALTGSWLASMVGAPLIRRNAELRAREAELRFALTRVSETSMGVAIYRGEADERALLDKTLNAVMGTAYGIANNLTRLNMITAGYGWLALVAPIVVASPGYFANSMSFGDLMIIVGAFIQVQQSLRWYVDNFSNIAELRAMLERVITFRDALVGVETFGAGCGRIEYEEHPQGCVTLERLTVLAPNGRITVDGRLIETPPAGRLRIVGEARSGKSTFFHALAGLWPWGSGVIRLPARDQIMFLPHRPYMPLGSLRAALTYPAPPEQFSDKTIRAALDRIGLSRLAPVLDRVARWDQELPLDEQQRVAYVRVLLHKPRWVIQDEALSELDETTEALAYSIFETDLVGTGLISIGGEHDHEQFYNQTLRLKVEPPGLDLSTLAAQCRLS
jgi:putative ATP-binding cassette transporter